MQKVICFLTDHIKYILILYVLIQLIYIFYFPLPYKSDSLYYYQLASSSLTQGTIYPTNICLYEDYIIAPLFVNLQIIVLNIFNSPYSIGLLHIILNLVQLSLLYAITKKYFNKESAVIFVLLYMFYLPNIGFILLNMTEVFFGVILSLSIYFMLKGTNRDYFLSGIFASASVAVRPMGWALLAALFAYILFIQPSRRLKQILFLSGGVALFILIMGTTTYLSSGHFIFTSVNYGTNFLIGANDDATGAYNDRVFHEGKAGFIENPESKTYIEKQQYWFNKAVNWIEENPGRWIKIFPLKLIHIFVWDDYAISPLLHMQEWNLYIIMKHLVISQDYDKVMKDVPLIKKLGYISFQILHHIYYFLIVIIFILYIIKNFKILKSEKSFILFLLVIGFAVIIPLFSFGDPRFKYPYILLMMILISPFLSKHFYKTRYN